MTNNRIYYAVQQAGIKADSDHAGLFTPIHGLQSCGMTTNFNLEQVFELGQISLYQNVEQIPDVQASLTKVLDGYPLMYTLATKDATAPTLAGRQNAKCLFGLAIFPDTNSSAAGAPSSVVQCSGMFPGNVNLSFPVQGSSTEEMTVVGNDKVWANTPGFGQSTNPGLVHPLFPGVFDDTDSPLAVTGVSQRRHVVFQFDGTKGVDVNGMVADEDATILPPEVFGVSASGTQDFTSSARAAVQSISVSMDFGREALNELGQFAPYFRFAQTPIQVSTEIQVISKSGDMISATQDGLYKTDGAQCTAGGNLQNRTIRVATCEGTRVYTGTKNKLSSVNYSGGDATGGNVSVSYQFVTFNDFTVMHSGDPNTHFAWADRADFLVNT